MKDKASIVGEKIRAEDRPSQHRVAQTSCKKRWVSSTSACASQPVSAGVDGSYAKQLTESPKTRKASLPSSHDANEGRKRGGGTSQTPGKRKPGNYLHPNGTLINGFGDDGNPDNRNGTPARQRGLGSNLGFSTEKDQMRASLAHAQRTINTLRGALQRKKEDALRTKKSSVISLGDTVKASDMLVRDNEMMMMMGRQPS
ncbi:uncharacterized protein VP01_4143g4 [Puccinia sorghi]|uniref:Uncharacterized protein n=1 Tax=Puccinia sorghi TaxID=27349 RepID=A0A0L6UR35_9BASI|nr:uncharacterized protein VP01_4143g4 [Puccinia sorghi]